MAIFFTRVLLMIRYTH